MLLTPYNLTPQLFAVTSSVGAPVFILFFPKLGYAPAGTPSFQSLWMNGIVVFGDAAFPPLTTTKVGEMMSVFLASAQKLTSTFETGFLWLSGVEKYFATDAPRSCANCVETTVATVGAVCTDQAYIQFGTMGYQLGIGKNVSITWNDTNSTFTFGNQSTSCPSLFFASFGGRKIGTIGPSIVSPDYNLAASSVELSLAATTPGVFQFQLTLEKDTGKNQLSDGELLSLGFHYTYQSSAAENQLFFPLIDLSSAALSLTVQMNPYSLFDSAQSFLIPGSALVPARFRSYFRTKFGKALYLTPQSTGRFGFVAIDDGVGIEPEGAFSVVYSSTGAVPAGGPESQCDMLMGDTGYGFLRFGDPSEVTVYFAPGNAFFGTSSQVPSRTSSTAWCCWSNTGSQASVIYYDQSPATPMYQLPVQADGTYLYLDLPLAELSISSPPIVSDYYPMVPYAGVKQKTETSALMGALGLSPTYFSLFQEFEATRLDHYRKSLLSPISTLPIPLPTTPPALFGVTPQGTAVGFTENLVHWQSFYLASDGNTNFSFDWIEGTFYQVLRQKSCFLVMTKAALTLDGFTTPENASTILNLAGWNFDFSPNDWLDDTVVIYKTTTGSIANLINDSSKWNWAEAAGDPTTTQGFYNATLARINALSPENGKMVNRILDDANWQGYVVINCPLNTNSVPPQLSVLNLPPNALGLIAPFLAVPYTPIIGLTSSQPPGLQMQCSMVSGLVTYDSGATLSSYLSYGYQVKSFVSGFEKSEITNCRATAEFGVSRLFGSQVYLTKADTTPIPNNVVTLSGSASTINGQLNLALSSTETVVMAFSGSILSSGVLDSIVLSSLTQASTTGNLKVADSRFALTGALSFRNLASSSPNPSYEKEAFDLFSYDDLMFSQMFIDMTTNTTTDTTNNTVTEQQSFMFNPGSMSVSDKTAKIRPGSLAAQFPFRFQRFVSNQAAQTPTTQLQLMPFDVSPFNNTLSTQTQWFGLILSLEAGNLGALGSNLPITFEVALVWSPNYPVDTFWFGIGTPGMKSNGQFFTFENVLGFGVKNISLKYDPGSKQPVIMLESIGLTVFGKTVPDPGSTTITLFGGNDLNQGAISWLGSFLAPGGSIP